MGTYYQHLDMAERAQIQYLLEQQMTVRAIAQSIGRSAGTVSRQVIERAPRDYTHPTNPRQASAEAYRMLLEASA